MSKFCMCKSQDLIYPFFGEKLDQYDDQKQKKLNGEGVTKRAYLMINKTIKLKGEGVTKRVSDDQ